ncbi:MAG: AraC family transcriptional regulator [Clostridiales bacterium]|nr:AraC family transcriptional regulator [Clostridiales bacterium]
MAKMQFFFKAGQHRLFELTYRNRQTESLYLMSCGIERCPPGYCFGPTSRPGYHFHVVMSGEGFLEVNGVTRMVHGGQIFVAKPGEMTRHWASRDNPWAYCWITFEGEKSTYYLEQAGFPRGVNIRDCNTDPADFCSLVSDLLDKTELNLTHDLWRLGVLYQFLGLAIHSGSRDARNLHSEYDPSDYVQHGLNYIRHNYASMKVGEVAASIGIDRSYFTKLFTQKMGVSPKDYMILLRMREGAKLLTDTTLSVETIAGMVGYNSIQAFTHSFTKHYHCSPGAYRRQPEEERVHLECPEGELLPLDEY